MKKSLLFLILALPFFTAHTFAQKFGHINSQELIMKLPEMDAALSKLEDMQTSNNERLKLMQSELQKLNNAYLSERNGMDAIARQSREKELQMMNQNIQGFYQTAQEEMQKKQQELTEPVIEKARKAVEEVGKEQGFLYVFDTSKGEVLYLGAQSVDVLPLVLKKLGIAADAASNQ
jgi:outer membrane protein